MKTFCRYRLLRLRIAHQELVHLAKLDDRAREMVLRREFVINRGDVVTPGSYYRRPRLDSGFVAAYESSAMCPQYR
jgi:hypothetical protein